MSLHVIQIAVRFFVQLQTERPRQSFCGQEPRVEVVLLDHFYCLPLHVAQYFIITGTDSVDSSCLNQVVR